MRTQRALYLTGTCLLAIVALAMIVVASSSCERLRVAPTGETEPVPSTGDSADDPAIWIHPHDSSLSTIIGTDKDYGLAVYDLSGRELQFLPHGRLNNVDLRYGFPLGEQSVALVTASNRTDDSIAIYSVDPRTRTLENATAHKVITTPDVYGACMYRSSIDGKYYSFVSSESGLVQQWELYDNGKGKVDAKMARSFDVGAKAEGCVADDELGYLYVGVEHKGIRKYKAEPNAEVGFNRVDRTGAEGYLTEDVEGLTIYTNERGTGYLIASSQGSDEFVVYEREDNNDYVTSFKITAGSGVDRVTNTDGIDVVNADLGPLFPAGLLVVQDGSNDDGNQNFKLVSWKAVQELLRSRPDSVASRN